MWIAEQLNSFINLGICKEYPTMARKSIPGTKANRTPTDAAANNKEQANPVTNPVADSVAPAPSPEVKVVAAQASAPSSKPATKLQSEVAPTPRKLEIAKPEPRKNLVPINLDDEIRRRAYELYEQRGGTAGSETEDWLRAEGEVQQRYHQRSA
jgi:Protein of unknown function (DUF2934)